MYSDVTAGACRVIGWALRGVYGPCAPCYGAGDPKGKTCFGRNLDAFDWVFWALPMGTNGYRWGVASLMGTCTYGYASTCVGADGRLKVGSRGGGGGGGGFGQH